RFVMATDTTALDLRTEILGEQVHGALAPGRAALASAHKNIRSAIDLLGGEAGSADGAPSTARVEKARGHMRDALVVMAGNHRLENDSWDLIGSYNRRLKTLMLAHP